MRGPQQNTLVPLESWQLVLDKFGTFSRCEGQRLLAVGYAPLNRCGVVTAIVRDLASLDEIHPPLEEAAITAGAAAYDFLVHRGTCLTRCFAISWPVDALAH
jgi:hypothetical protein